MADARYILAIDQGTTSTRSIIFDRDSRPLATAQRELEQFYPHAGWVEHDAEQIWRHTLTTARQAIEESGVGVNGIAAIGITNQRETTVIWDKVTGDPIHRAIVWQDRRTKEVCNQLRGGWRRRCSAATHGITSRPVLLGHQSGVDTGRGTRRAGAR